MSAADVTHAAPLEKAVAEAREALVYIRCDHVTWEEAEDRLASTLAALLAALDADKSTCVPGVICPTCIRLEEAEKALMHIKQGDLCVDGLRPGLYGHGMEFARRYFAEKGER